MTVSSMQHKKPSPAELPAEWRALAAQQRRLGAEAQARILDVCADELAAALRRAGDELLSLARAAKESGYTADHLSRMVRAGKVPNAGRKAKPLIRRSDIPMKTARVKDAPCLIPESSNNKGELFRDIIHSKFGGDDGQS